MSRRHRYCVTLCVIGSGLIAIGGIACGNEQEPGTTVGIVATGSPASTQGKSGSQLLIASPVGSPVAIGTVPGSTPPPWAIVPDSDNPELMTPSVPYQPSEGIPAISPRTDHRAGQPAFTEQDARAFVTAHPPFMDSSQAPPRVTKIEFLSAHDAEAELQTSLDGHSDLVCVVWLSGTFNVPESPPSGVPQTPQTGNVAEMVFDATTGNLLVQGIYGIN